MTKQERIVDWQSPAEIERDRLRVLIPLIERLTSEVIVGYENEQQEGWAVKQHQCEVCYNSAKRLRAALKESKDAA